MATKRASKGGKRPGGGKKGTKGGKRPGGGGKKGTGGSKGGSKAGSKGPKQPRITPQGAHDLHRMFQKCVDKCFDRFLNCLRTDTDPFICMNQVRACIKQCADMAYSKPRAKP
jgi:hypothetical protein